jgi:hypothetical protein
MTTHRSTDGTYRGDERAVSEVLGAILVFGLLLAVVLLIQITAVPGWNQQIEYDHSERAQDDIDELANAIERAQTSERSESVNIELGVDYPTRPFLYNPPPTQGTLETPARGTVTIEGAQASGEVGNFWDGSAISHPTRAVTYRADYNEFRDAPRQTVYEHGVVANQFRNSATVIRQSRPIVSDDNINLVALTGTANRTDNRQTTVAVTPVSRTPRTVAVTGLNGNDITISLRTTLPEETWQDLLEDELADGHVESLSYADGTSPATVTLTLDGSVTYDLQTALVGVGDGPQGVGPAYLERIEGGGDFVPVGASDRLTVEVRDKFNAPKSGIDVQYELLSGDGEFPDDPTPGDGTYTVTSTASGQTSPVFRPLSSGSVVVEATAEFNGQPSIQQSERVQFNITSSGTGSGDGDGDGEINPADSPSVTLDSYNRMGRTVTMTFENLDTASREWTDLRVPFYSKQAGGPPPTGVQITPQGKNTITTDIRDGFEEITPSALAFAAAGTAGDTRTVEVTFQGGSPPSGGDYFIFTARHGDGGTSTYFVAVRN